MQNESQNLIKQTEININHINDTLYNVNLLFFLLKRVPVSFEENETSKFFAGFREEILKLSTHENWLENLKNYLVLEYKVASNEIIQTFLLHIFLAVENLQNNNQASSNLDLAIYLNENKRDYNLIFNNDFYKSVINEENITESIVKTIVDLKNKYKFKEIFYSNEISPRNLLKQLLYTSNALEEIVLNLEVEYPEFLGTRDQILCIDLNDRTEYKDGFIYISTDIDDSFPNAFFKLFFNKVFTETTLAEEKNYFIEKFWESFLNNTISQKEDKFVYIQLFSEYIYDNKNFIIDNNLNKNKELDFINNLLDSINGLLDQKESLELNFEKNLFFYNKWREDFENKLEDYNIKRMLNANLELKREIFKIAFLFKYIILNDYKYSFWKDLIILSNLVDTSFKYLNEKDLESFKKVDIFIFNIMKNKELMKTFVKTSKDLMLEEFMRNSFIGFLNYYRENKSNFDKTIVPYIEQEALIEKEFWESHVDEINEILQS